MAVACSIFNYDGGLFYGFSALEVVSLKVATRLEKLICGHFYDDNYGYTCIFQPSGTHRHTKKSNVFLSMLFFLATLCQWDHIGIWYINKILKIIII